jgi:hypothetical protein
MGTARCDKSRNPLIGFGKRIHSASQLLDLSPTHNGEFYAMAVEISRERVTVEGAFFACNKVQALTNSGHLAAQNINLPDRSDRSTYMRGQ